ncbi:MAG: hypothetical protein KGS61_02200, partial [Verrucomicrobia bacterium]|nr:hypothetical protein [Verrucomicrobiota bacterium]
MRWRTLIAAGLALFLWAESLPAETLSLAGKWRFAMDQQNAGLAGKWFAAPLPGDTLIKLPGTMDDAKLGLPNPIPPSLAGLWRPVVYEGVAWYQRKIVIPASWRGQRVTLFLERCRWVTQAWLDGQPRGAAQDSLIAPHVHALGVGLAPGQHTLTLRVDNTPKIDLGGFVSALYGGTPGNLNGIVGRIELRATPPVWLDDVEVYPNVEEKSALVRIRIGNETGQAGSGTIEVAAKLERQPPTRHASDGASHRAESRLGAPVSSRVAWDAHGGSAEIGISLGHQAPFWDEFHPALFRLTAT